MSMIDSTIEPGTSPFHEGRSTTELPGRFAGGVINSVIRVNSGECLRGVLLDFILQTDYRLILANFN